MRIKNILISQSPPLSTEKSPYSELSEKYGVKIDFRPFIQVEAIPAKEFRQSKISILNHSAIILTGRTAVDHFFRMCEEMRLTVPDSMKYFCISESTAYYLQKYIIYRKRKIFHGKTRFEDLIDIIYKHRNERYLLPLSDIHKQDIPELLNKYHISFTKATFYRTICADLSDIRNVDYDILVFFSPSGVSSLIHNFPDFKQNDIKIAAFGPTTAKAINDAKLRLDIQAPSTLAPSMTMALEQYLRKCNKKK